LIIAQEFSPVEDSPEWPSLPSKLMFGTVNAVGSRIGMSDAVVLHHFAASDGSRRLRLFLAKSKWANWPIFRGALTQYRAGRQEVVIFFGELPAYVRLRIPGLPDIH
jgi:hypothetical protein